MMITKIEHADLPDMEELQCTRIHIIHNGMEAYYYIHDSFQPGFHKEIVAFQKAFFNNGEESWQGCFQGNEAIEVFDSFHYIRSLNHEKYMANLEEQNMINSIEEEN